MLVSALESVGQKYFGVLLDLTNKLSGPSREYWFAEVSKFLRGEFQVVTLSRKFTLSIDAVDPRDRFRIMDRQGKKVNPRVVDLVRRVDIWNNHFQKLDVVILDLVELGCEEGDSQQKIIEQALQRGYRIPPVEVAFALAQLYSPEEIKVLGFDLLVVMHEPLLDSQDQGERLVIDINCDHEDVGDTSFLWSCSTIPGTLDYELIVHRDSGLIFLAPLS